MEQQTGVEKLVTVKQIAERVGWEDWRVRRALDRIEAMPLAIMGRTRVYDAGIVEDVNSEIERFQPVAVA